jgi:hypothetical protein
MDDGGDGNVRMGSRVERGRVERDRFAIANGGFGMVVLGEDVSRVKGKEDGMNFRRWNDQIHAVELSRERRGRM